MRWASALAGILSSNPFHSMLLPSTIMRFGRGARGLVRGSAETNWFERGLYLCWLDLDLRSELVPTTLVFPPDSSLRRRLHRTWPSASDYGSVCGDALFVQGSRDLSQKGALEAQDSVMSTARRTRAAKTYLLGNARSSTSETTWFTGICRTAQIATMRS